MAIIYVRSTNGSDANDGSTWALAKATLAGAAAIVVSGDTVWVSQNHSESTAGLIELNWAGTSNAHTRILCGNDGAEPPTQLATTATIETTGNNNIHMSSGGASNHFYAYGLNFRSGVGATGRADIRLNLTQGGQLYEACAFYLATTDTVSDVQIHAAGGFGELRCKDCTFRFSHVGQQINSVESPTTIRGGSVLSGVSPTALFAVGPSVMAIVEGFDMSNCASSLHLSNSTGATQTLIVRNCKLPASWTGSVNSATPGSGSMSELHNSDGADTNYRYQRKTQMGLIDGETTIVRTGGATNGVTALSWKMVSNANAGWNHHLLETSEIVRWNETVGSPITVTIEVLHDSVTNLTNQQIWLEVQYLGTSGSTLSTFVNDSSGDYLSSASDQTVSSASWTTTGMANPNTQKLHVTVTPQEPGYLIVVVRMAMASKTVYVCPKLELS